MKKLGLIGYPLSHSFSETWFGEKFLKEGIRDYEYRNYPIREIGEFKKLVREEPGLVGLNVTIPYKRDVISCLGELDQTAEKAGAVNTILISRQEGSISMKGYNTDVYGFRTSLAPFLDPLPRGALILGTGGASRAVEYVLRELGIPCSFVSRTPSSGQMHYRDLCQPVMKSHTLIVNTTPLGTWPEVKGFPSIPYDLLGEGHILYDLVYNPPETGFLRLGREKGATTINGLKMLELQAEASWNIWTREQDL